MPATSAGMTTDSAAYSTALITLATFSTISPTRNWRCEPPAAELLFWWRGIVVSRFVMPALVAGIHIFPVELAKTWMAVSRSKNGVASLAYARP